MKNANTTIKYCLAHLRCGIVLILISVERGEVVPHRMRNMFKPYTISRGYENVLVKVKIIKQVKCADHNGFAREDIPQEAQRHKRWAR